MSSVSSIEIDIPFNDDIYIRQLDEYRVSVDESESGSGSGSDGEYKKITYPEAMQRLEKYLESNELEVLQIYIQCKRSIFEHAAAQESFKYNALNIHSLVATIALAFLPWFNNTHIAISVLSGFIFALQQWIRMSGCCVSAQVYADHSRGYSILLGHIDNSKYISNKTLLKNIESKLECLDHVVPCNYNKLMPVLSSINIFAIFKHIEYSRNIQIRKFIYIENKINRGKSRSENVDAYVGKVSKIKNNLSKLNYNKLIDKMQKECASIF